MKQWGNMSILAKKLQHYITTYTTVQSCQLKLQHYRKVNHNNNKIQIDKITPNHDSYPNSYTLKLCCLISSVLFNHDNLPILWFFTT